jgi:hypothetical protein
LTAALRQCRHRVAVLFGDEIFIKLCQYTQTYAFTAVGIGSQLLWNVNFAEARALLVDRRSCWHATKVKS